MNIRKTAPALCVLLLLLFSLPGANAAAEGDTVREMTLEEKVGQIMMVFFEGPVLSENLERFISELRVGGVILYSSRGNIESVRQVASLNETIQQTALFSRNPPLFIGIDQEGGLIARIREGVTLFPGNMALGAAGDPSLAARVASVMGEELASIGINMNFAPVMDVNNNPRNPIIGVRSFGSDPEAVSRLGSAMISKFLEEGVLPSAKHFPGHGDTDIDSHSGLPIINVPRSRLESVEFPPFRAAVAAGVPLVMTAHVIVPALDRKNPATLSPAVLGTLRSEMGFDGLIITDSMGMGALKKERTMEQAAVEAFNAGADILLFGADRGHEETEHFGMRRALIEACRTGAIRQERLDEAVRRILAAKKSLGLLEDGWKAEFNPKRSPKGETAAREAASRSITVVRNRRGILQNIISDGKRTPLLWPEERIEAGRFFAALLPFFDLVGVRERPDETDIAVALKRAGNSEVVLIAEYDANRNAEWINLVKQIGEERTVLLSLRTPYALLSVPSVAGAIVAYSDNPPSLEALADVLKGKVPAVGALPVELPGFEPVPAGTGGCRVFPES